MNEPLSPMRGIHRVALPTPYPVGRVNAYLLEGDPLTLIDTGVKSERSLTELDQALRGQGRRLGDLDVVVLTHRHFDHAGAALELDRRAGGLELRCHPDSLLDEKAGRAAFLELIARYGAPEATLSQLEALWRGGDQFGDDLRTAPRISPLDDGDRVHLGGLELEALHTPGHSPGHLCLVARERRVIFCGDLLLARITANPLPHFDAEAPRGRLPSLALFLTSLERVLALGPMVGLPGHGEPLDDTAQAASRARRHVTSRSEKVLRLMRRFEGLALFALAQKFFWQETITGQALAFCELLAHADLLEDQGRITVDPTSGVVQVDAPEPPKS